MRQVRKFLLLGAASTLLDFAAYTALMLAGADYVFAIVAGYTLGLLFNYYGGRRFIFTRGIKVHSERHEFAAVVGIAVGGVLLNIVIVKLLSYSIGSLDPLVSRIVAIVIVFFWNFGARKRFVYH